MQSSTSLVPSPLNLVVSVHSGFSWLLRCSVGDEGGQRPSFGLGLPTPTPNKATALLCSVGPVELEMA